MHLPAGHRKSVPIRLAIVGLPRLLCDLIAAAFSEDDSVEIRTLPNHATLMTDGVADSHEVVIVGEIGRAHV